MLVIPHELSGIGIERHGRIAVKVRRRRKWNRPGVPAVTGCPRVRHRVGDAPENQPAHRVVSAGQSPRRGQPSFRRRPSPRLVAGLACRRHRVEPPRFFSGFGIVRRDVTVVAHGSTGPAGEHLAVGDNHAGGEIPARLGFPFHLTRAGIDSHDETVGRRIEHHVFVDRDRFGSAGAGRPFVLPDRRARRRIDRQNAGARSGDIDHAAVHNRDAFLVARPQFFFEDLAKLPDVLPGDLLERAETLRIVGPAVHQPVIRTRIREHLFCDRREARRDLGNGRRRKGQQSDGRDEKQSAEHHSLTENWPPSAPRR